MCCLYIRIPSFPLNAKHCTLFSIWIPSRLGNHIPIKNSWSHKKNIKFCIRTFGIYLKDNCVVFVFLVFIWKTIALDYIVTLTRSRRFPETWLIGSFAATTICAIAIKTFYCNLYLYLYFYFSICISKAFSVTLIISPILTSCK